MTEAMYDRRICGYLNYKGDVRGTFVDRPMGPGYDGEYRYPIDVSYDEETNMSRVGFTKIAGPPPLPDFNFDQALS